MTTEKRLEIIRNKAKQDEITAEQKANDEELKREELKVQIRALKDRIQAILTCANECVKNGIKIPESDSTYLRAGTKYGYDYEFMTDGIYHGTGLWSLGKSGGKHVYKDFKFLGIMNVGANGPWDFITDGVDVMALGNSDNKRTEHTMTIPNIEDMEKFLRQFPEFEAAFYNWIDSLKD